MLPRIRQCFLAKTGCRRSKDGNQRRDFAADFRACHKISLDDAFAAALAKERKTELVTGDPEFRALEKEIKINWLK
jgi:predicted nucleic acid-binding protein